jgi:hypothetical protein
MQVTGGDLALFYSGFHGEYRLGQQLLPIILEDVADVSIVVAFRKFSKSKRMIGLFHK